MQCLAAQQDTALIQTVIEALDQAPRLADAEIHQLFQVKLALKHLWLSSIRWPSALEKQFLHVKRQLKEEGAFPTKLQKNVCQALKVPYTQEYFDEETGHFFDISLGKKSAIEVDGPSHFVDGGVEYLGKDKFTQKLYRAMGWTVYHVSYREWDSGHYQGVEEFQNQLKKNIKVKDRNDTFDSDEKQLSPVSSHKRKIRKSTPLVKKIVRPPAVKQKTPIVIKREQPLDTCIKVVAIGLFCLVLWKIVE